MQVPVEAAPIEVHDLTVAYQHRPVLWDIDISFPKGELIGVVGPNGAGKSTLIKAIMGLVPLASGHVKIFGQTSRRALSAVAYVPQRESVDWDFPALRSSRKAGPRDRQGEPGESGHGGLRHAPD